jgi:hypothetical protein
MLIHGASLAGARVEGQSQFNYISDAQTLLAQGRGRVFCFSVPVGRAELGRKEEEVIGYWLLVSSVKEAAIYRKRFRATSFPRSPLSADSLSM